MKTPPVSNEFVAEGCEQFTHPVSVSLIDRALKSGLMCAEMLVQQGGACGVEIYEEELPLIKAAIKAMGDASTRKDEGLTGITVTANTASEITTSSQLTKSEEIVSNSNLSNASEIPVVNIGAKICQRGLYWAKASNDDLEDFPEGFCLDAITERAVGAYVYHQELAPIMPVSVSLEKCARTMCNRENFANSDIAWVNKRLHYRELAKAVLREAGVKYE